MVDIFPKPNDKIISAKKALKNIKPLETPKFNDGYAKLWDRIKPGQNASHVIGKGFNSCVKLDPNRPSCTLPKTQSGHGFATICHWREKRAIAINEALILSSFPENYKTVGTYSEQWARIGNAVMPKMMEAIARQIIIYLKNIGMNKQEHTVISTFAGCGGSSLGYKWAGFTELLAIDLDKNSVETFALNFPEVPVWQRDIKTMTAEEILEFCKIKRGELDVLDGSPPCQGFSTAGRRIITDERNDLFREYARLVDGLQPKVFVMENVSGLVKGKMKGKFIEIMRTLKSLDYEVRCKLMNAKHYNVPQSRERLIWIGVRKDIMTTPTFPIGNSKIIPVRKALLNCPKGVNCKMNSNTESFRLLCKCKPGQSAQAIHPRGFFFNFRRLPINEVSPTIIKNDGKQVFHYKENRLIYDTEAKRLTSFPDNFILTGLPFDRIARIGNSVPPKFMEAIAGHIRTGILDRHHAPKP